MHSGVHHGNFSSDWVFVCMVLNRLDHLTAQLARAVEGPDAIHITLDANVSSQVVTVFHSCASRCNGQQLRNSLFVCKSHLDGTAAGPIHKKLTNSQRDVSLINICRRFWNGWTSTTPQCRMFSWQAFLKSRMLRVSGHPVPMELRPFHPLPWYGPEPSFWTSKCMFLDSHL